MSKLAEFKKFIASHPEFAKSIVEKNYSYQTLYETYDMYGEEASIWSELAATTSKTSINLKSITSLLKKINPDNIQNNLGTVQKAVKLLEDISSLRDTGKKEKENESTNYKEVDKFYSD